MRRSRGVFTAVLATVAALAAPAGAVADAPPGEGLVTDDRFSCDNGASIIVHSAGPSSWIEGGHYLVASRTFVFADGTTEVTTLGEKSGLSGTVTCTAEFPFATLTLELVLVG
jgi:hypothetical protein